MAAQPSNPVSGLPRHQDDATGSPPPRQQHQGQPQTPAQPAGSPATQGTRSRVPTTRKQAKYSRRNIALANAQSKNALFRAIHPLHIATIAFAIIALGVMSAGLATNSWFVVSTDVSMAREGLFKRCIDKPVKMDCETIEFTDTNVGCERSGSDIKAVNLYVRILCFATLGFAFIGLLAAALARAISQPAMSVLSIVMMLLAFCASAASLGMYMWNKERWEYCDESFCDYYKTYVSSNSAASCEASYGFSTGLAAISMGACLVGFIFATLRFIFREWNIKEEEEPTNVTTEDLGPRNRPRAQSTHEPYAARETPQVSDQADDGGMDLPPPPEGGDWVFDAESGMYWSEQEFLFMDPYTQHSYDPNSDMWYDPDAEEWYEGEQLAEDGAEGDA